MFKRLRSSPRTSLLGLATIVQAIAAAAVQASGGQAVDIGSAVSQINVGVGLLLAGDA